MTSVSKPSPSRISTGTTFSLLMSGCRAFLKSMIPSSFSSGTVAFILSASRLLAKSRSSCNSAAKLSRVASATCPMRSLNSCKIRSISSCSSFCSILISLLASTTAIGSIKTVAPLEEVSCTRPLTSFLHSILTGTTKRPSRMVMIGSCSALAYCGERMIPSSCSRTFSWARRMRRRRSFSAGEAVSAISSSERMASKISFSSPSTGASTWNRS